MKTQRDKPLAERPRALVTGASRGIGKAIALELGKSYPVIVHCVRGREAAEATKSEIEAAGGIAEVVQFDVTDGDAAAEAIVALKSDPRPIGIVVNNAGVAMDVPLVSMTRAQWTTVTRTTLDGFFHVTQPLAMDLARLRWGRIVNITSVSGVIGNRGQVNYSAAKAGLIGATKALALEMAKRNVTVNAVAPGPVATDMWQAALAQGTPEEEVLKHIPMRRIAAPEDVAALVGFLCSDAAGYVTGQVIGVNGGMC